MERSKKPLRKRLDSRKEEEQLRSMAEQASLLLKKIPREEIVRVIRESRDEG